MKDSNNKLKNIYDLLIENKVMLYKENIVCIPCTTYNDKCSQQFDVKIII